MCRGEIPSLVDLFNTYVDDKFALISIHFPYAGASNELAEVKARADSLGVNYPVAIDKNLEMWNAYGNRTMPAFYAIDAQGQIRFAKFGGGGFEAVIEVVEKLKSVL